MCHGIGSIYGQASCAAPAGASPVCVVILPAVDTAGFKPVAASAAALPCGVAAPAGVIPCGDAALSGVMPCSDAAWCGSSASEGAQG